MGNKPELSYKPVSQGHRIRREEGAGSAAGGEAGGKGNQGRLSLREPGACAPHVAHYGGTGHSRQVKQENKGGEAGGGAAVPAKNPKDKRPAEDRLQDHQKPPPAGPSGNRQDDDVRNPKTKAPKGGPKDAAIPPKAPKE